MPGAVAPILKQRGFATSAILTEWAEIVGPRLAGWATPLEIRWPKRAPDGEGRPQPALRGKVEQASRATLVVTAPGAFALDIQMASGTIIEAVNRRLGFGCIGAIQILQAPRKAPSAPMPQKTIDPALIRQVAAELSDIADDDIRLALARLGAEIAARADRPPR